MSVTVGKIILNNIHIKIADSFKTELHINKDDAMKNNIKEGSIAVLKED